MKKDYVIFTDSTTDLPYEEAKRLELEVLPLTFHIDDKSYKNELDYREMSAKDFFDAIRNGAKPTTSQLNSEDYTERVIPYLEKGIDVLILSFSSALSGSFNSGRLAVQELSDRYPERKIEIIDTKSASLGEGMLVYLAAEERLAGKSMADVIDFVNQTIPQVAHWFTVTDIKHLRRGGRISMVKSILAQALNIKPIMNCNVEGKLVPKDKVRTRRRSIEAIFQKMKETALPKQEIVFISHGDDIESAEQLASLVKAEFNPKKLLIHSIGPVIGAHTGQGVLALFYLATTRE